MKQARILFFADSHLGLDYPIRRKSERRYRGDDFFRNLEYVLDYAKEEQVDLVIHGGDLFDRSDVHRRVVGKAYDMLFAFVDQGIPLVLVPGNHDRSTLPMSLFLQHPNLKIFFEPQVFRFQLNSIQFNIAGFPFVRKIGAAIPALIEMLESQIENDATSILLMHQSLEGAQVGPADYTFRRGKDVIGLDQLQSDTFQAYLSGHIHRHQILDTENTVEGSSVPFIYPGSIERTSFAEKDEVKGFTILEFFEQKPPAVIFKELPSRTMHAFTISHKSIDRDSVEDNVRSEVIELPQDAIVKIESPTVEISNWLRDIFKQHNSFGRDIQIRHKWLPRITKPKRRG